MLKLKNNAVPTLFAYSDNTQQLLPQITNENTTNTPNTPQTKTPDEESLLLENQNIEVSESPANETENNDIDISSEATISEDEKVFVMQQKKIINNKSSSHLSDEQKMKRLVDCYTKAEKLRKTTKKKLLQAKRKIKYLEKEVVQ